MTLVSCTKNTKLRKIQPLNVIPGLLPTSNIYKECEGPFFFHIRLKQSVSEGTCSQSNSTTYVTTSSEETGMTKPQMNKIVNNFLFIPK